MIYTLATPVTVGDINNQTVIDQLELASMSLNFEPVYSDKGTAFLSIVLVHRASGHKINVVYSDASALDFWTKLNAGGAVESSVFAKLRADGKLPVGTVS